MSREERPSRMVLTVTEDTPADMLAGSMELLVQLPREHHLQTQRVTVQRSTPMMDLLVQIATAHKLAASSYTLQAIGERGLVLPHQPNTPIGALDALQVKLLPKQGTFVPRKTKQANQPFETTFRLQVHLPRNQLYVSRVSPKMNLGEILEEVCREKNLDKNKYELRHPANLEETLDLSLSLQDYHLQEVTLYAKQGRTLGSALSTQDIMALQRQEERRRQQAKQGVFGFVFKKSKEGSLSTDSLGGRSASPARSDETGRSASPLQPPARPQRKRRPAPKPPIQPQAGVADENADDSGKDKVVISHSRNSSDSSGYHEASVLSDNPDSAGRLPETLPRRSRPPMETPRKLAQTSQSSKSLGNLATVSGTLARGISSTSLSSAGLRKKRAAPPPPVTRPLSSAISTQALERIVDSEESLTSDMDPSKPPSDIGAPSKANSDIEERPKANSDIGVTTIATKSSPAIDYKAKSEILTTESKAELQIDKQDIETLRRSGSINVALSKKNLENTLHVEEAPIVEARVTRKRVGEPVPLPKPRKANVGSSVMVPPKAPKRRLAPLSPLSRTSDAGMVECLPNVPVSFIVESNAEGNHKTDAESTLDLDISDVNSHMENSESDVTNCQRDSKESNELLGSTFGEVSSKHSGSNTIEPFNDYSKDLESDEIMNLVNPKSKVEIEEEEEFYTNEEECIINEEHGTTEIKNDENLGLETSDKNNSYSMSESERNLTDVKLISKHDKRYCAVISTLPKCEHLDALIEKKTSVKTETLRTSLNYKANEDVLQTSMNCPNEYTDLITNNNCFIKQENVKGGKNNDNDTIYSKEEEDVKDTKRTKILRSMSKSNDFEINSFKKQKRHLTSHAEDITYALNLNLSSNVDLLSDLSKELVTNFETHQEDELEREIDSSGVGEEKSHHGLGISGTDLSDTDILLQKVSDTLSNTLPVSSTNEKLMSSNVTRVPPMKTEVEKTNVPSQMAESMHKRKPVTKEDEPEEKHGGSDSPDGINVNTSNMTLSSQQDTSDYVSAVDEDLLIAEWEYQLPAPPSAFRDNTSPIFDSYDSVIVRSVDTTKELGKKKATDVSKTSNKEFKKSKESCNVRGDALQKASNELLLEEAKKGVSENKFLKQSQKLDSSLKKEMINELENKIGSLPQTAKDFDSKRVVDSSSTPKVAPVDNTLSNFTITTYTRQKNLNIFNEVEQQSSGKTDDRFVRSFATLSRNRNHENSEVTIGVKEFSSATLQNKKKVDKNETTNLNIKSTKLEPKMHDEQESLHRWQPVNSGNEKINIQRSKSYVSTCDKGKYGETCESKDTEYTGNRMEGNNVEMKKATSISNLSANRNNEKFSQWRDNILKRQEEPTKEKQLQSLQVLKSILPQLKSAQQAEENVSKEYNGTVLTEETRSETATSGHSMESNVVSTRDSQAASNSKNSEVESKKLIQEANAKRYTYSGPPAINLGSWSERPSVNVQIKTDMDYKLGAKKITNGRTIVNINGARDERDYVNCIDDTTKSERNPMKSNGRFEGRNDYGSTDKKEPDELTKKFITHTTAAGFKKPILNKVNIEPKTMLVNDKPIVTGVELKKTFREKAEAKDDDSVIDTSPVNFKELTKAFGQDVYLRSKPKRSNMNRHSDLCIGQSETLKQVDSRKQNGHVHFEKSISTNDQSLANGGQANLRPKRFTSIVGIQPHNQGQNFTFRNAVNIKSNQPMPVVKGFKIQASNGGQGNQNGLKENLKDTSNCNTQPPKPPTMPVITGVTLKNNSVRPKSMPAQVNPRDMLLESIRNFGGREKLKSSAERC